MKTYITFEQAISVLPKTDTIHTFYNPGFGLVGADWNRDEIIDKLSKSEVIELTGETARGIGHGVCAYNKDTEYHSDILFIETDEQALTKLEEMASPMGGRM